jgi:hypothetical protein
MPFQFMPFQFLKLFQLALLVSTCIPFVAQGAATKPVQTEIVQAKAAKLDTAAAHAIYTDGDFDEVIAKLEPYLTQKLPMSRAESLFVFKHLGVIFSKDAASREKGKYCFRKLFDLNPEAQILDMYATDDIYAVFRLVRDEWALSHPEYAAANATASTNSTAAANPSISSTSAPIGSRPAGRDERAATTHSGSKDQWKMWSIAGGAALVTAGVATWFLVSQPDEKTKTTFVIDPQQPAP